MKNTEVLDSGMIATSILRGDADNDLEIIYTALKNRKEAVALRNLNNIRVGQKVRIFGLSPKAFNGKTGKVTGLPRNGNSKRFNVELDSSIIVRGAVTNVGYGIPVQCLELIED